MKVKAFALAGVAGSLFVAGAANAVLTGVVVEDIGNPDPGQTTYQVFATFDSPADYVLAASGNPNAGAFIAQFNNPLINDGGAFANTKAEDFAGFPISGLYDSWVTIGATGFSPNDTNYSPDFLDNDGLVNVIQGTMLSSPDEGWFDADPTSQETAGDDGRVLLAQFTVVTEGGPSPTPGIARLQFVVDWQDENGLYGGDPDGAASAFVVAVPAPGAMALLGLAGLAGTRRRRG